MHAQYLHLSRRKNNRLVRLSVFRLAPGKHERVVADLKNAHRDKVSGMCLSDCGSYVVFGLENVCMWVYVYVCVCIKIYVGL